MFFTVVRKFLLSRLYITKFQHVLEYKMIRDRFKFSTETTKLFVMLVLLQYQISISGKKHKVKTTTMATSTFEKVISLLVFRLSTRFSDFAFL